MITEPVCKTLLSSRFKLVTALLMLVLICFGHCEGASRPNIVIFLADDAGWGDYSHSGNRQVATPQIDSLAQQGISLDRFYVCPVCAPTRAEFLTGRYHPRGGVRGVSTGQERLDLVEKTLADACQSAGYATGAFGKWHNGTQWPYHPMARGFDQFVGYSEGHWGEYFDAELEENGRMIRSQGYIVDACTDRALQFIEVHQHQRFLCYVPFTTPHSPWAVPAQDWERFKDRPLEQRATESASESLEHTRCALAMMENQDANVGRVLNKLKDLKLEENTIVLYFSDNGPSSWRWNGGMKGKKGTTDEGGVRSVCYLRWPARFPAGKRVTQIAGAIDLLPTLLNLAEIPRVGQLPLDGRDLSLLLLQPEPIEWSDRMIFSTWGGKISVRTQQYRLDDAGQLFDMVADPGQSVPINDQKPDLADHLSRQVQAWRLEMSGNSAPLAAPVKPKPDAPDPVTGVIAERVYPVDPRPIPVGFPEFPLTLLPARDGEPRGGVKRSASAPNSSYFVNWTKPDDSMVWRLKVQATGRYDVVVEYTCPEADAGSLIELTCGRGRVTGSVTPGWDPPLYSNQDTLPRPRGESTMKAFRPLKLGVISLTKGEAPLILRALEIPQKSVMEVRRITLTLLDEETQP